MASKLDRFPGKMSPEKSLDEDQMIGGIELRFNPPLLGLVVRPAP